MNTLTIDIYVSDNNPTLIMLSANTIPRPEACLNAISDICYFRYPAGHTSGHHHWWSINVLPFTSHDYRH